MTNKFSKRKNDVLSKLDKSFIGGWDEKIKDLCEKINSSEDYYTTSSCSGRIVLMVDEDKKKPGLFIKVYHDKVGFGELRGELGKIMHSPSARDMDKVDNENSSVNNSRKFLANGDEQANIKFKMEPCILHVACRDLKCAQELFDKAKLAGWKKSGIIASGDRVMLELNSTERLEFPVVCDGKIIVGDGFLKIVVKKVNKKLERSWEKIEKLGKMLE